MHILFHGCTAVARFDASSQQSIIPRQALPPPLRQGHTRVQFTSPITVYLPANTFTSVVTFQISEYGECVLGLDWFSGYREYLMSTGVRPPNASTFSTVVSGQVNKRVDISESNRRDGHIVSRPTVGSGSRCLDNGDRFDDTMDTLYASTSQYVHPNIGAITSSLFMNGSKTYAFSRFNPTELYRQIDLHGLQKDDSYEITSELLAHHLLNGLCSMGNSAECTRIARNTDMMTLRKCIVGRITELTEQSRVLTTELNHLCHSLGYEAPSANKKMLVERISSAVLAVGTKDDHFAKTFITYPTKLSRRQLLTLSANHGISAAGRTESLIHRLQEHEFNGQCAENTHLEGCKEVLDDVETNRASVTNLGFADVQNHLLREYAPKMNAKSLREFMLALGISVPENASLHQLRSTVKRHLKTTSKGKSTTNTVSNATRELHEQLSSVRAKWPSLVPRERKRRLQSLFREQTSSDALRTMTCACCSRDTLASDTITVKDDTVDLSILRYPGCPSESGEDVDDSRRESTQCGTNADDMTVIDREEFEDEHTYEPCTGNMSVGYESSNYYEDLLPYSDGPFRHLLVDRNGIRRAEDDTYDVQVCKDCSSSLARKKLPKFALANKLFLGEVPDVLKGLTQVEESVISLCRAKTWIVQLPSHERDDGNPGKQKGMKGHTIIYPQDPGPIATMLPPSIEDIVTPICVLFVGSSRPTVDWLKKHASPLIARADRIRAALVWLKKNNPLYHAVRINEAALTDIETSDFLPYHFEGIQEETLSDSALTDRYDAPLSHTARADGPSQMTRTAITTSASDEIPIPSTETSPVVFDNVVVSNVEGITASNELRSAAIRHISERNGAFLQIPHGPYPVNEFNNPQLFPMMFPTLFPYGLGGLEEPSRSVKLSLKAHVQYLFSLHDSRFREHHSFMFTAFNILQRRAILLQTSLKVRKDSFNDIAQRFGSVSLDCVQRVAERVRGGITISARDEEERRVLDLMKEVSIVTSHVPGSASARLSMRNEIRGLMMHLGLPSFYITINPADIYNPVVKFLAGSDIDVDALGSGDVPNFFDQSLLVAKNPVVAAQFFHQYMKSFVDCLLKYDPNRKDMEGGLFGVTSGYYGCVEAQGRGTLHCHMLVWLEGGLNPNEIKDRVLQEGSEDFQRRMIAFLDDAITTHIPPCPEPVPDVPSSHVHPCTIRGLNGLVEDSDVHRRMDLHNVAKSCQQHTHGPTCYKYSKSLEDRECRFGLDESNHIPSTTFDLETGEITLQCLDGMVNNFNETILETMRCNMDIKFIGSGPSAKAILHYITDYISKSQLKAHVAFAALERAVDKLGEFNPADDLVTIRAKAMLQKCAHAMISQQELSAQQVCSLLLGYDDKITSHQYRNFYWTPFERLIEAQRHSPECSPAYLSENTHDPIDIPGADITPQNELDADVVNDQPDGHGITIDVNETGVDEDEVVIERDDSGRLRKKTSVVSDYIGRGPGLENISLWDFIAQCDKRRSSKLDDGDDNVSLEEGGDISPEDIEKLLERETRERPSYRLATVHDDYDTHFHVVRHPLRRLVVVPTGPSIPRRDQQTSIHRYYRLMLIFFCPWRSASDLAGDQESWESAFKRHTHKGPLANPRVSKLMENMQILHECRDSRDHHWANRHLRRKTFNVSQELTGERACVEEFVDYDDGNDGLHNFLTDIDRCHSVREDVSRSDVLGCLVGAQRGGLFTNQKISNGVRDSENGPGEVLVTKDDLKHEIIWRNTFEARRTAWREKNKLRASGVAGDVLPTIETTFAIVGSEAKGSPSSTELRASLGNNGVANGAIDDVVNRWSLNADQAFAFKLIAERAMGREIRDAEPLRMFLNGPAGTGKSRVINALKDFFEQRNENRRLRVCSYMGIAARNVCGMTLHSALNLSNLRKHSPASAGDLREMWEGVDFLFIDEVSMLSCRMLCQISRALSTAKGNPTAFGGINLIFAGDFAQLPPIVDKRLYGKINVAQCAKTVTGQDTIFGKLLWLSVNTVVTLTRQHRQGGPENAVFVDLLSRLREGRCSDVDFSVLMSRMLSLDQVKYTPEWRSAPIIVYNNAAKDALNDQLAMQFAFETGQTLHWYYSLDKVSNGRGKRTETVDDEGLQEKLWSLHSGKSGQRLGRIPLVIGMPVLISQNFDVVGGIVNGSRGFVRQIRYTIGDKGRRHLQSCIVEIADSDPDPMPGLSAHHYPILGDTTSIKFTHPFTREVRTVQRTQVPIIPAFAMTAHRAQGQTMDRVIIDLESCRGTEAPYVMLSRASSLEGVALLRPFSKKKIMCALSQDQRAEKKRLDVLSLKTLEAHGTVHARKVARDSLAMYEHSVWEKASIRVTGQITNASELLIATQDAIFAASVQSDTPHRIRKTPLVDEERSRDVTRGVKRGQTSLDPIDRRLRLKKRMSLIDRSLL